MDPALEDDRVARLQLRLGGRPRRRRIARAMLERRLRRPPADHIQADILIVHYHPLYRPCRRPAALPDPGPLKCRPRRTARRI